MSSIPRRGWRVVLPAAALVLVASLLVFARSRPAAAADGLISQDRPTTSSSTESGGTLSAAAVDGDATTRWSSAFADPQWIQIDLVYRVPDARPTWWRNRR
jgi:F5/8 type C domain